MRPEESQVVPVNYVCYKHSGVSNLHKKLTFFFYFFLQIFLFQRCLRVSLVLVFQEIQLSEAGGLVVNEAPPSKTTDEVHKNKV